MKFTLVRDGEDKILKKGSKVIATWDKHEVYEYCVECAQARLGPDDELVEKKAEEPKKESVNAEVNSRPAPKAVRRTVKKT